MSPLSKENALTHYRWGGDCEGWTLVDEPQLSVKLEKMPPQRSEQRHYHQNARQFFFILAGTAVFEIEGQEQTVTAGQGIHIHPGQKHQIRNEDLADLEFILSSQPNTANDRFIAEK